EFALLRVEVRPNLLLKKLLDLRLPSFGIDLARLDRPIQTHTQRQRVLVLARQRNQVLIAKHGKRVRKSTDADRCSSDHRSADHWTAQSSAAGASSFSKSAARSVSQSVRTRSHSCTNSPYASKNSRMRRRSHHTMSSRIAATTARAL